MKRILLVCLVAACAWLGGVTISMQIDNPAVAQKYYTTGDPLMALSERFETVASKVSPSVVCVEAVKPLKPMSQSSGRVVEESGSGIIVRSEYRQGYYVLTNNHVIAQAKPEQITIQVADGRIFKPGRIWADPETDIALLGLDGAVNLPTAILGNSENARVGRFVLAIGSPFGLSQTVTHGIISARERGQVSLGNTIRIKDFLQTDAPINPGSSGGPLIDMQAEVIGINTAIASNNGSSSGVAFSIPINLVKRVMRQLLQQGNVSRGYIGMQLAQQFEAQDALKLGLDRLRGALVDRVYPETPAATAGLKPGDVILQVDNMAIRNENHLINFISSLAPGQRVRLMVWRDRAVTTLEALVGDWNNAQSKFREP